MVSDIPGAAFDPGCQADSSPFADGLTASHPLTWSVDQVYRVIMKTMLVSEFKAKCIAVLKEVARSGEPVVVTLRGRPMARVEPFTDSAPGKRLGVLKGTMRIRRDLTRVDTTRDWEMLK